MSAPMLLAFPCRALAAVPLRAVAGFLLCMVAGDVAAARDAATVPPATLNAILKDPLPTPISGSREGDVTLVEYFDYNCPGCRELEPELRKLVASDPKVRLIRKDWPVFGEASIYAAYCSYAAARLGKYELAHTALLHSKQDLDSKQDVRDVMRAAGFDLAAIDADIARHEKEYSAILARNQQETAALGLRGTPGLIVGNQLVPGSLKYPQLLQLIVAVRKR